jgi:O-phosphoseryl-tRNA(Cys) synthetase
VKTLTGPIFPVFRDAIFHVQYKKLTSIPPTPQLEVRLRTQFPNIDLAHLWNLIDGIDDESSAEEFMCLLEEELCMSVEDSIMMMNILPEITEEGTVQTSLTMRAFMPTAWIDTLKATYDSGSLPIRLFTVGQNFRREAQEDRSHLRTYNVFSLAIMDSPMEIKKAKGIVKLIMDTIGVSDLRIVRKRYQFPYFKPGTEYEIFGKDIEIGTFGLMDEGILRDLNIEASVLLIDIGIERLLMQREGYTDIRVLSFPQFFDRCGKGPRFEGPEHPHREQG